MGACHLSFLRGVQFIRKDREYIMICDTYIIHSGIKND